MARRMKTSRAALDRLLDPGNASVTLQTLPGIYVPFISPTPLQMIGGLKDFITCTDLQLEAYNRALEPKTLVPLSGGHFAPYEDEFELAGRAARDWFVGHLGTPAK